MEVMLSVSSVVTGKQPVAAISNLIGQMQSRTSALLGQSCWVDHWLCYSVVPGTCIASQSSKHWMKVTGYRCSSG